MRDVKYIIRKNYIFFLYFFDFPHVSLIAEYFLPGHNFAEIIMQKQGSPVMRETESF